MNSLLSVLSALFAIAGAAAWIFILIDAFKDAIWKGVVFLLCGLYGLYYSLFEFEHNDKLLILLIAYGGSTISAGLLTLRH